MLDGLIRTYARLPNHPAKLRIVDAILRATGPVEVSVSPDTRLVVDGCDHIGRNLLFHGAYEPRTVDLARRLLADGGVFVDIGANLGLFSVSLTANPNVRAVAIEPDPANFLELTRNIALNRRTNIRACNIALSGDWGFVSLEHPHPGNRGMTRVRDRSPGSSASLHPCTNARTLFRDLALERIDVLKMDVEGHEATVLTGLDLEGALRPRHVIMERNGLDTGAEFPTGRRSAHDRLLESGYTPRAVDGAPVRGDEATPEDNVWYAAN